MVAEDSNSSGSLRNPWHCFVCPLRSMADPDDPVFSGDLYTVILVEHGTVISHRVKPRQVMQYNLVEGLVLGTVLTALGDGLVIPKMQDATSWLFVQGWVMEA